ncbi:MAG TPA: uroporphyrinogen decarboxylase [Edaphobacter sp.]|nr:uroporphyrinogen decarboxylase [Edaphobacter sp.]
MTDPIAASVDAHSRTGRDFKPRSGAKPASGLPRRSSIDEISDGGTMTGAQRFLHACLRQPVDVTPVWFLRQAGRYMAEYQAVRRHHSLLEICRTPQLASEVTITAAEKLDVDAAIIFADLLLPFTPMGLDFEFVNGEGPVVHKPVRSTADIDHLRTDRAAELGYVGEAISKVAAHFKDRLGIIGFCGAPYTLASYMVEGGGSRNWIETKKLMYADPGAFRALLEKLIEVLTPYCQQQIEAGADAIQIFDSWVGCLSVQDYREFVLPLTTELIRRVQSFGVPVIYFGVDTASLLPAMRSTGADVLGLDWRVPLDAAWAAIDYACAVQGNLDPITLFAPQDLIRDRVHSILSQAAGRPGHIFNVGHGIVPGTPVESVQATVRFVREYAAATNKI